ncbi:MAG: hypothetical protein QOJ61_4116 [Mycobacterium sp.]|nr:hypothetical protein [Mycobacterium sp.]
MAIFGRNTARQRLRRAARESLKIPAFSSPIDCTPWVTGGLWPAELSTVTAETAPLVKYLRADLQRIVNSANEELKTIRRSGLADPERQAEEARVIEGARAFAVRRVESSVRHLRKLTPQLRPQYRPVNGAEETEKTRRFRVAPRVQTDANGSSDSSAQPLPESPERDRRDDAVVDQPDSRAEPVEVAEQATPAAQPELAEPELAEPNRWEPAAEPEPEVAQPDKWEPAHAFESDHTEVLARPELAEPDRWEPAAEPEPEVAQPDRWEPAHAFESDDTEVLAEIATVLAEIAPLAEPPVQQPQRQPSAVRHPEPPADDAATTRNPAPLVEPEADRERVERLLKFVARQEPGLRWAIGNREDGTTLLVTDLAHGWIPPGITLPAEVRLLEPGQRSGNAAALLGRTTLSATYAPSDPLGWATDYDLTNTSSQPRELPAVDDLGWLVGEATHWRDGLPRIVHTLAKAGAAGTGVVEAEIDLLRVYLDTTRYQLLAQYPDVDPGALLNCLLLAAAEGIATGNTVNANYHFAWFQMLSGPPASSWKASP